MKKIKNESGFTAVELILVVVVIALLAVAGWMVYKNHHKAAVQKPDTTLSAVDVVAKFYKLYTTYEDMTSPTEQLNQVVAQYGSSNLISYYNKVYVNPPEGESTGGIDPIVCSEGAPNITNASDVTSTSKDNIFTVMQTFNKAQGSEPTQTIKVTVVNDRPTGLKIDSVTCDPPIIVGPSLEN